MKASVTAVLGLSVLILTGCNRNSGVDASTPVSASQVEGTAAVQALVHDYQQARAAQQWDLALSYANKLQHIAPNSVLISSVQATLVDTSMHADEVRDRSRLAGLWKYNVTDLDNDASDGVMSTASIAADAPSDAADSGSDPGDAASERLVLRNHPKLGRSMILQLDHGDFDCVSGCKVTVQFDDQPTRSLDAKASAENRQSLSIGDEQSIRDNLDKIRVLTVVAKVDGRPRSMSFDVGGFDRVQLDHKLQ